MAKYAGLLPGFPTYEDLSEKGVQPLEAMKIIEAEFGKLQEKSDSLKSGEIVGGLLSFPVGDGYACYVVTVDQPLTVAWAPTIDEWSAPAPLLRGLNRTDVEKMLEMRRGIKKIFGNAELGS